MAGLTAVVAATAGGSAAQTESRAVGLDVAQSLAVVALLGLGRARKRAAVGLVAYRKVCQNRRRAEKQSCERVAYLAACLLKVLVRVQIFSFKMGTYSCSRDARQRSKPRHSGQRCHTCSKHDEREKTWLMMCYVLIREGMLADGQKTCRCAIIS